MKGFLCCKKVIFLLVLLVIATAAITAQEAQRIQEIQQEIQQIAETGFSRGGELTKPEIQRIQELHKEWFILQKEIAYTKAQQSHEQEKNPPQHDEPQQQPHGETKNQP